MLKISRQAKALIGRGWHVLDVGSGYSPFPLATVLVDRMPKSHAGGERVRHENPSGTIVHHGRPHPELLFRAGVIYREVGNFPLGGAQLSDPAAGGGFRLHR